MSMLAAFIGAMGGFPPITVTGSWVDMNAAFPATFTNGTGDPTLTWTNGGNRTISVTDCTLGGVRQYRINSGAWTAGTSASISSGQTIGFRGGATGNAGPSSIQISDSTRASALATISEASFGYP